jgi:hypothetical protein
MSEGIRIEDDLGDHPVSPLGSKQALDLSYGLVDVIVRFADGDKTGIPVPLMGIKFVYEPVQLSASIRFALSR